MRGMNSETVDLVYLDPPFSKNRKFQQPMNGKIQTELIDYMENNVKKHDQEFYEDWHRYIHGYIDKDGTAHPAHLVNGKIVSVFDDAFSFSKTKQEQLEDLQTAHPDIYNLISAIPRENTKGYMVFIALRVIEIYRILKSTGSLYLHCDYTAHSYIRLILDLVFGVDNLRNEIVWSYNAGGASDKFYARKHDTIYFYTKYADDNHTFNVLREPYATLGAKNIKGMHPEGRMLQAMWPISKIANRSNRERIGYPTQKPLALLERVIKVSSNENDIVFDPFAGCATTLEVAFRNNRQWIGADISFLSSVLLRFRIWRIGDLEHDQFCRYRESTNVPPKRSDVVREEGYYSTQEIAKRVPVRKWYGEKLYVEQHGICKKCHDNEKYKNMDVDHIRPISKGGSNNLDNLQLLCRQCNVKKGNKIGSLL